MEQLIQQMLEAASFVPGLVALADPLAKDAQALTEANLAHGLSCVNTPSGLEITIGIIITPEVKAVAIVGALSASLKALVKRHNLVLANLNVFVRGVTK